MQCSPFEIIVRQRPPVLGIENFWIVKSKTPENRASASVRVYRDKYGGVFFIFLFTFLVSFRNRLDRRIVISPENF